jgi:hypothetical protein
MMSGSIQIEDIESMRRVEGIDDTDLRDGVRKLKAGDLVRLTFLPVGKPAGETLSVRITGVAQGRYSGELAQGAVSAGLAALRPGVPVMFTADHIHSLGPPQPAVPRRVLSR